MGISVDRIVQLAGQDVREGRHGVTVDSDYPMELYRLTVTIVPPKGDEITIYMGSMAAEKILSPEEGFAFHTPDGTEIQNEVYSMFTDKNQNPMQHELCLPHWW